jgi:ubiquitin-protein ligase
MATLKKTVQKMIDLCNNSQNNIKINKYLIFNQNEVLISITIPKQIEYDLYTDFNKYCYINKDDLDFNYNIISIKKTPENILKELLKIMEPKNNITYNEDPFNLNYKISVFNKIDIDYNKFFNKLIDKSSNYISKLNDVPKSLLLSSKNICNLIIQEIKKVNQNKEYKHFIDINNENPFCLIIKIFIDIYTVELNLILDTYPYLPPIIEIISPPVKDELYFSLLNLNILQFENWMSSITIEYIITNVAKILEPIFKNYVLENKEENNISKYIIKLAYLTKDDSYDTLKLFIDIPKINESTNNQIKYWKSGTGYSSNNEFNTKKWDINKYISEQEILKNKIIECLIKINSLLCKSTIVSNRMGKNLINYISKQIKGLNILELENNLSLYNEIFLILDYLFDSKNEDLNESIVENLEKLNEELNIIDNNICDNKKNIKLIINKYINYYVVKPINKIILNNYCEVMKNLQFTNKYEIPTYHKFYKNINDQYNIKNKMRIISEINSFKSVLPLNNESTIWCLTSKINFNVFTFIISGPKDTPYENGLFEFHAYFPPNYPDVVPQVLLYTTGNGKFRFNPNLYENGKVCLSLLGTWSTENESEKWNKTSTFLQVMISIQSLIFIEQPYFNEPSYETTIDTPTGIYKSKDYNEKIYPRTIEFAMIDMLKNPPVGFEEIVKNHFKLKKEEIIETINKWKSINSNKNDLELMIENLKKILNNY